MRFFSVIVSGRAISTTAGSPFAHISSNSSSAGSNRPLVTKNSASVRSFGLLGSGGTTPDMFAPKLNICLIIAAQIAPVRFFSQTKGDGIFYLAG
jgi:hypothetical protein